MQRSVAPVAPAAAGDVIQTVEAPKGLERRLNRLDGGVRFRRVAAQCFDRPGQGLLRSLDIVRVASEDNHLGARFNKCRRGGQSDSGRAADDDQDFIGQL